MRSDCGGVQGCRVHHGARTMTAGFSSETSGSAPRGGRDNPKSWASLAMALTLLWATPLSAWSFEKTETMQAQPSKNARKATAGVPAGPWQGRWDVTRDHPQIRTRAGALALQLEIDHDRNNATPRVQWIADRALCESPTASPCEWVGSRGVASSARVVGGHLLLVLQVSADDSDPMVVWLERPQDGRSASGTLISARGDLAYALEAQRP